MRWEFEAPPREFTQGYRPLRWLTRMHRLESTRRQLSNLFVFLGGDMAEASSMSQAKGPSSQAPVGAVTIGAVTNSRSIRLFVTFLRLRESDRSHRFPEFSGTMAAVVIS